MDTLIIQSSDIALKCDYLLLIINNISYNSMHFFLYKNQFTINIMSSYFARKALDIN